MCWERKDIDDERKETGRESVMESKTNKWRRIRGRRRRRKRRRKGGDEVNDKQMEEKEGGGGDGRGG